MIYGTTGTVSTERQGSSLVVRWTADASGVAVAYLGKLFGTLDRVAHSATAAATAGNHAVQLVDWIGFDLLQGLCASIADATASTTAIFFNAGGDMDIPIVVCSECQFRITGADASDSGITTIYWV